MNFVEFQSKISFADLSGDDIDCIADYFDPAQHLDFWNARGADVSILISREKIKEHWLSKLEKIEKKEVLNGVIIIKCDGKSFYRMHQKQQKAVD